MANRVRAATLDTERGIRVVGERRQSRGRWLQSQPERARRGLAVREHQRAKRAERLEPRDLLLEDRRDEGLEHGSAPPEPQSLPSTRELTDERMRRCERGRRVVEADERGHG